MKLSYKTLTTPMIVDHCDVRTLVYRRPDVPEFWLNSTNEDGSGQSSSSSNDSFNDTMVISDVSVVTSLLSREPFFCLRECAAVSLVCDTTPTAVL